MAKRQNLYLEYALLGGTLLFAIWFFSFMKTRDLRLARHVLAGLIRGRPEVSRLIDWENFSGLGVNVGQAYTNLSNEKERDSYRSAFISGLQVGFLKNGGSRFDFRNWKVYKRQEDYSFISVEHKKGGILLLVISKSGVYKLVGLEWLEAKK